MSANGLRNALLRHAATGTVNQMADGEKQKKTTDGPALVDEHGNDLVQIRRLLAMSMRERLRDHERSRRAAERLAARFRGN